MPLRVHHFSRCLLSSFPISPQGWEETLVSEEPVGAATAATAAAAASAAAAAGNGGKEEMRLALPALPRAYLLEALFRAAREVYRVGIGSSGALRFIHYAFSRRVALARPCAAAVANPCADPRKRCLRCDASWPPFTLLSSRVPPRPPSPAVVPAEALRQLALALARGGLDAYAAACRPGGLALSEKGVLQLVFDVRFLCDVLAVGAPEYAPVAGQPPPASALGAAMPYKAIARPVLDALTERLDPIDWATYEPFLVVRFTTRIASSSPPRSRPWSFFGDAWLYCAAGCLRHV